MRLLLAIPALAFALSTPAFAQQTKGSDPEARQAVEQIVAKFTERINKHDVAGMTALFADDAVLIAPTGAQSGHEAIEKFYVRLFKEFPLTDYVQVVDQVDALPGGGASANGHWNYPGGSGYWGTLYEEEDGGTWKIRMNVYNRAPPTQAPLVGSSTPK